VPLVATFVNGVFWGAMWSIAVVAFELVAGFARSEGWFGRDQVPGPRPARLKF